MRHLITSLAVLFCTVSQADDWVELFYSFSGDDGDSEMFFVDLPERVLELKVESSGVWGDVDIFVFRPGQDEYLDFSYCSNRRQSSKEICQLGMPSAGQYRVNAKSFQPESSVIIRVSYLVSSLDGHLARLLSIDERMQVDSKTTTTFKTRVSPNRKSITFLLEQANKNVLMKVYKMEPLENTGYLEKKKPVCEVLVKKEYFDKCDIKRPEGTYIVQLVALGIDYSERGRQAFSGLLSAVSKVDDEALTEAWRDQNVKALKWQVPKTIPKTQDEKSYFFELEPNKGNRPGYMRRGVFVNSIREAALFDSIALGHDLLINLSPDNCYSDSIISQIFCGYSAYDANTANSIRVKVKLMHSFDDIEIIHTDALIDGEPSPTCPIKDGCDGDPET